MTTTPSPRADARRRYVEVASAQGLGADAASAGAGLHADTPLTTRVRTLYEDTIVPVADIARLAGVTERTIYKYAQRRGWRPRVVRLSRGAGGRFTPLAEADRPVATGLKALDPDAALRAGAQCVRAGRIAEGAAAAALHAARKRAARKAAQAAARSRERALAHLSRGLASLAKTRALLRAQGKGANPRLIRLAERMTQAFCAHMLRVLERA